MTATTTNPKEKVTTTYRGYTLETIPNGRGMTTIIYDENNEPAGGCFSLDEPKSSVEKAQKKIDGWLKNSK